MPSYDTGFSVLPPVGTLEYNGIQFSSLFASHCNGTVVPDDAARTTKWVEWTLVVDGYVTLKPGETSTDQTWNALRQSLTETGATLIYTGNGFGGLTVNQPGGLVQDLAWGPIPKILEFQTMGATGAAKIKWQVVCHVPEINLSGGNGPITQFNYSAVIGYDENAYSTLTIEGVLEMGMTRASPGSTQVPTTIDAFRQLWLDINIDLNNFHVPKREFKVSPDMRTCAWYYQATQLSPMGLPAGCIAAGGNVTVRPMKMGQAGPFTPAIGMIWGAQMRASYTVPPNMPRRIAAEAFFSLLHFRMQCGANNAGVPAIGNNAAGPQQPNLGPPKFLGLAAGAITVATGGIFLPQTLNALFAALKTTTPPVNTRFTVILTDLTFDEGLYNDSKKMDFSASWIFAATFNQVISASGMWKRGPEVALWGDSMRNSYGIDIAGWRGPLKNELDPNVMAIVDFGHQDPLNDQLLFVPELGTILNR